MSLDNDDKLYPELENSDMLKFRLNEEFNLKCEAFRKVFGNDLGRIVLAHILELCHFGVTLNPDNPAEIAEYNVGITVLAMSGWLKQFCLTLGIKYEEGK